MHAEITLTFKEQQSNLLLLLQTIFPLNQNTLANIIGLTIYQNRQTFHNCFVHGFHATDATLLFQIIGNEMKIHLEVPQQSNLFTSLQAKVNSYFDNIMTNLKSHKIETDKIEAEVIILSEDSYLITGKRQSRWQHFVEELDKDKLRLIIIPTVLLLMNIGAKKFGFVNNIESSVVGICSMALALILWYVIDFFSFTKNKVFKYQPIND